MSYQAVTDAGATNDKTGRPRGTFKMSEDARLRAARRIDDGWSVAEVAAAFGVSITTIQNLRKRMAAGDL